MLDSRLRLGRARLPAGAVLTVATLALGVGCGPRRVAIPTDAGAPLSEFAQVHERATSACRPVRSLTAVLSLSGRAGGQSVRGELHAGFALPDSMRMELRAGLVGTVVFVLVSRDASSGTLWLPREERVVRNAPAAEMIAALTGLRLGAADLLAILTGCGVPDPRPAGGRRHDNGWASVDLGGATMYLEPVGDRWRARAVVFDALRVEYPEWQEGAAFPARVQLRAEAPVAVDLRLGLSQFTANVDLEAGAFTIERMPADAAPMTVEELREMGPLRER